MENRLGVEFDMQVNALYVRLGHGLVAESIEIGPDVLVDVDEDGSTIGFEFINADDFIPFLREHGGSLPASTRWTTREEVAV